MAQCSERVDKKLECSVCLEYFQKPIKQCVIGHSFCARCLNPHNIKKCPECRSEILETRNYKLEELLDTIPIPCENKGFGCPFLLCKNEMDDHILECKHRNFKCEGKIFCKWECKWEGRGLLEHFKSRHATHASMEFNTSVTVPLNDTTNFCDIQIISAHYQLFWYKHKIDIEKQKAFWAFQYIGPSKQAKYYYYEFEIYNEEDPTRKFKITEYCQSDLLEIQSIFDSETCVAISFTMLKNYLNKKNLYSFRFRLMKKPKPDKDPKPKVTSDMHKSLKKEYTDISTNVQRVSYVPTQTPQFFMPMFPPRPNVCPRPPPKANKPRRNLIER